LESDPYPLYIKQLKGKLCIICPLLEPEKELKCGVSDTVNYFREWDSKGTVKFLASATWQTSPLAVTYSQDADKIFWYQWNIRHLK